jgi:predicted nuclease of predicted toxin-antitoxin system
VRFLVDADLPRSSGDVLRRYGHVAIDVRAIGLGSATDTQITGHAQSERLCLLTGDFDFADIRNYPPTTYAGIVVLELPREATASFILRLIENLLQQSAVLAKLEGRLAIVEAGRVRLRPP